MRSRRDSSFASGPATSFATPVSASLIPSITPSAPAEERSVTVTKVGRIDVAISWPESLKKLANPTLPTPRVNQPRPRAPSAPAFCASGSTTTSVLVPSRGHQPEGG
jgi:hypothetical protein